MSTNEGRHLLFIFFCWLDLLLSGANFSSHQGRLVELEITNSIYYNGTWALMTRLASKYLQCYFNDIDKTKLISLARNTILLGISSKVTIKLTTILLEIDKEEKLILEFEIIIDIRIKQLLIKKLLSTTSSGRTFQYKRWHEKMIS